MEMKDLTITMTPQGVIAGKIMDKDGDPVVSAQVQTTRYTYASGRKQLQATGGAQTNDLGEYRLINLAPGRYYICATDSRPTLRIWNAGPPWARGHSAGRKHHDLLSQWSRCLQRGRGGCRRWQRNARHRYPLDPGQGLHSSRQGCGFIRRIGISGRVPHP